MTAPPNPSFHRTCAKGRAGRRIQTFGLTESGSGSVSVIGIEEKWDSATNDWMSTGRRSNTSAGRIAFAKG